MDPLTLIGLAVASGAAGAVNAVAGGGTLIAFPALMAAGYSSTVANVTNTVAIWPGTIGGSLAYRRELGERGTRVAALTIPSVLGGLVGSVLLLSTSDQAFRAVVPFLIYFACILLYLQPRLSKLTMLGVRSADDTTTTSPMLHVGIFLVGVYGGYFGAGIGILMLAILGILAPDNLHHSNAIKGMLAMIINFTALVVFALRADVAWGPAGVMAVASIVGGYVGVHFARRISPRVLRTGIIGYGAVIATVLLLQR